MFWGGFRACSSRYWTDKALLCPDRRHQPADAEDVHHPLHIVREHVQGHLRADLGQGLHLEVGCTHPGLESGRRLDAPKVKPEQIQLFNKDINHPHGVVFIDSVLKAFWKERALTALGAFDKTAHVILSNQRRGFIHLFTVFTQLGDQAVHSREFALIVSDLAPQCAQTDRGIRLTPVVFYIDPFKEVPGGYAEFPGDVLKG